MFLPPERGRLLPSGVGRPRGSRARELSCWGEWRIRVILAASSLHPAKNPASITMIMVMVIVLWSEGDGGGAGDVEGGCNGYWDDDGGGDHDHDDRSDEDVNFDFNLLMMMMMLMSMLMTTTTTTRVMMMVAVAVVVVMMIIIASAWPGHDLLSIEGVTSPLSPDSCASNRLFFRRSHRNPTAEWSPAVDGFSRTERTS